MQSSSDCIRVVKRTAMTNDCGSFLPCILPVHVNVNLANPSVKDDTNNESRENQQLVTNETMQFEK